MVMDQVGSFITKSKFYRDVRLLIKLRILSMGSVFCLVDRRSFSSLSPSLQAYAPKATQDLLDAIGFPIPGTRRDLFVFSSESAFYAGVTELKKSKRYGEHHFTSINSDPTLLIDHMTALGVRKIFFDFGSSWAFAVSRSYFDYLSDLVLYAKLAAVGSLCVVQSKAGYALPLELNGKRYVIGFLNIDDGIACVKAWKEKYPACQISEDNVRDLALGMAKSDLAGIVINPGLDDEMVFEQESLKMLVAAIDLIEDRPATLREAIMKFLDKLFKKQV